MTDVDVLQSAQRQAYEHLRERITADDTAAKLSLSSMPVREAIRQLAAEKLVMLRRISAVVIGLAPEEIVELFEMHAALEGFAVRSEGRWRGWMPMPRTRSS